MDITYVEGDATQPVTSDGLRIIAHICNDEGTWGAGFVLALSQRDKAPEEAYKRWAGEPAFGIGAIQIVPYVGSGLLVANMVAQHGFGYTIQKVYYPPVRYLAVASCLHRLQKEIELLPDISVHMPRIGCGLGGGKWEHIEPMVKRFLCDRGVPVTVYDLPILLDTSAQDVVDRALDLGTPAPCCGPNGCR